MTSPKEFDIFFLLSDSSRRKILKIIHENGGNMRFCSMYDKLNSSVGSIYHHLYMLESASLILNNNHIYEITEKGKVILSLIEKIQEAFGGLPNEANNSVKS